MRSTQDQQPIQRTVGRRKARDGQPMSQQDRDAMTRNANYLTRVPKGVFFYRSHDEMEADRLRWTVDLMVHRQEQMDAAVIATALKPLGGDD